jgi:hypothetical protein
MPDLPAKNRRRGPIALTELVSKILGPVTAKRGFAKAELIAAWPAIVGPAYAAWTAPEKIVWPRTTGAEDDTPGVLVLRVDGPRAIYVQHELPQIVERVNAFLGYAAVGQARIVQGPVVGESRPAETVTPPLAAEAEAKLAGALAEIADEGLRASLDRLGRGILATRKP